jgi:hypothetical protein
MRCSVSLTKLLVIAVVVSVLVAFGACAAPAPATQPKSPTPAPEVKVKPAIVLSKDTVDRTVSTIEIKGTGFTPGSTVVLGIPTLPTQKDIPGAKGVWFEPAKVSEKGEFTAKPNLAGTLFSIITNKVMTEQELLGKHIVVAEDDKGQKAEASLTVVVAPPAPAKK